MIAEYLVVDDTVLNQLKQLNDNERADFVIQLIESETYPPNFHCDVGKLWDVLHFVLTKKSATKPVPNDPLSECIVGLETFSEDEETDFIAYNEWPMIAEIVDKLETVNFAKRMENLQLKSLREANLFPEGIWQDKKANLVKELTVCFNELKALYETALDNGNHVIVSIL